MTSDLGIVVIGRNEGERLKRCLGSLGTSIGQTVYVDSGSTDGSPEYARSVGAHVVNLDLSVPFTAARARNEGFRRLREILPDLKVVQFVDGDCELEAGWFEAGRRALAETGATVVFGRRRERDRNASYYNRACDLEWDVPIGEIASCGGDAMMVAAPFLVVGGFDESLIAGEEGELCSRLRARGAKVRRIDAPMTIHDAALLRFGQWWRRAVRAGYAEAEGLARRGTGYPRAREALSHVFWAFLVPLGALVLAGASMLLGVSKPLTLVEILVLTGTAYAALWLRVFFKARTRWNSDDAACYANFCVLAKWPGIQGMALYWKRRLRTEPLALIEYKRLPAAHAAARKWSEPTDAPTGAPTATRPSSPTDIGIVVIGRNEGERLRRCFTSLGPLIRQTVYVDSGSTDDSVAHARSVGAEVVELDTTIPFTAARARNAGFQRQREMRPDLRLVQFVDGDCELEADWFENAVQEMAHDPLVAVIFGRCKERARTASWYNRVCDLEWDVPLGYTIACGGNALMLTGPLQQAGGYDASLIAGEEPDLCFRLREQGWRVLRIAAPMVIHDAAIHSFRQWWRRAVRSGYVEAEGWARLGARYPRIRSAWSHLFWGFGVPVGSAALAVTAVCLGSPWSHVLVATLVALGLAYGLLWARVLSHARRRWPSPDAACYASFCVLAKWPGLQGMATFWWRHWRGSGSRLIEHKRGA